jgi:Outer membrane protein beta-barrel domain
MDGSIQETSPMRRALFALLFLLPAAAFAQPSRFELTPFAGYRADAKVDSSSDLGFNRDVTFEGSSFFGVAFDIPLTGAWQVEILANRQKTSLHIDAGLLSPSQSLGDINLDYYQAGFLYQWGRGQVNPYVVATGGVARLDPDFPGLEAKDYFAGSLGGGVKVFVSSNVGFRFDARGYWANLRTHYNDHSHHDDRYDSKGDLIQGEGSVGVIFAF